MNSEITTTENIALEIEDLNEIMVHAFSYIRACLAGIQKLPGETITIDGLAKLGLYECDIWGNQLDCTLEDITQKLRELSHE